MLGFLECRVHGLRSRIRGAFARIDAAGLAEAVPDLLAHLLFPPIVVHDPILMSA